MAPLVRTKRSVTTPAIADGIIERRWEALGFENFSEYVNSLVAYDCWAEKAHVLTGDACSGERINEEILWREIIADEGKPDKVGSFFAHRVKEFLLLENGGA